MVWRGDLDLPSRLEGDLPRFATECIVALAGIGFSVGLRLIINQFAPNVVPFALTFPAIVVVTLLAGARAGMMTLVACQMLVWYFVLPPVRSFALPDLAAALNLILVTVAQLLMLWSVAGFRRVTQQRRDEDQRQIDYLSLALKEIDHRTKNNFQMAISLLSMQAHRAGDEGLKNALGRASARLQAIASVYRNLAMSSSGLEEIRLHEHLAELCNRLRDGLLSPAIDLDFRADPAIVAPDVAIRIGLILNELVTNAAKHAFPEGVGTIRVRLVVSPGKLLVTVQDNGTGLRGSDGSGEGLGTRLVDMLAQQIDARRTVSMEGGLRHELEIPTD